MQIKVSNPAAVISLVTTLFLTGSAFGQADKDESWTMLFDGTSLDAWKGYKTDDVPSGWVIDNGTLKHDSGEVDLVTRETFGDFELRFNWKIAASGNSGVIYRCDEKEAASYMTGPEYQLLDNKGWQQEDQHVHSSAAIYGLFPPTTDAAKPTGEWNTGRIVVRAGRVEHWLNDKLVASADLGSDNWQEKIEGSKFAAWKRFGTLTSGHIALQAHRGKDGEMVPVWFREVKIRRL